MAHAGGHFMGAFSDETEDWRRRAASGERPFAFYDHGTLVITVVCDERFEVTDTVRDRGFYCLRAADPMRPRTLKYSMRPTEQRAELDPDESGVDKNKLHGTLRTREAHFECRAPDFDRTCRFDVRNEGAECFETRCVKATLASSFFARMATDAMCSARHSPAPAIDVLFVTALKDEGDAVASTGARFAEWRNETASTGIPYRWAQFEQDGNKIAVALGRATDMGGESASVVATGLLTELMSTKKPALLAMTGLCGGHPAKTELGDVIIADRVFKFDEGKREVVQRSYNAETEETIFHDFTTFKIHPVLKHAVEDYAATWNYAGSVARPKSVKHQTNWLLWALHEHEAAGGVYPRDHAGVGQHCPDWETVLIRAEELRLVRITDKARLTDEGLRKAERDKSFHRAFRQDPEVPRARIGSIGTSSWLQKDATLFAHLEPMLRSILAVEMEAEAIARVAHEYQCGCLIAKSVMDYANLEKNDKFRAYAADTSADFVLSFLLSDGGRHAIEQMRSSP
jgi:nucleoside phosphorylase